MRRFGMLSAQDSLSITVIAYKFLHDRIQQAAYSLVPEEHRSAVHLRIGRKLLASMTANELTEDLFEVANQLNRGCTSLIRSTARKRRWRQSTCVPDEKRRRRRPMRRRARILAWVIALLDERDWGSRHELIFSLSLECAECELLCGNHDKAAQLIAELLQRAASPVEFADASCLKINLHVLRGEHPQAVDSALACLRLFGIDLPAHPTLEQVQGRIRDGVANPRRALDRKSDRSAADDRSENAGSPARCSRSLPAPPRLPTFSCFACSRAAW